MSDKVKLHVGGSRSKEGWKILNILPGPTVDILGSCTDLSMFGDGSVDEIYASHVLEHLPAKDMIVSLREFSRVLKPGGLLKGSVPNLDILFRLFLENAGNPTEQVNLLQMIYGGHIDEYDIHHFGFNFQIMAGMLGGTGFSQVTQYDELHEFEDTSVYKYNGTLISLNFVAVK